MQAIRVTQRWQVAGVHYVRIQTMVKGFQIPLDQEFDEKDEEQAQYVLILDGIYPIATCRISFLTDGDTAKIERVSVLAEYRNQGVGRLLISAAEEWITESAAQRIVITSRKEAVGFYESLGYQADYNQEQDAGIFRIVYTQKILR